MEYLSIILTEAKAEIEAEYGTDQKLGITLSQGFYFEVFGENYMLILETKQKQTTVKITNNSELIYSRTFKATQTMTDVLEQLDRDIIIYTAVESIQRGWQSELTESGSIIDFKDYKEYITEIRQKVAELGIRATIEATFSGLQYTYNR